MEDVIAMCKPQKVKCCIDAREVFLNGASARPSGLSPPARLIANDLFACTIIRYGPVQASSRSPAARRRLPSMGCEKTQPAEVRQPEISHTAGFQWTTRAQCGNCPAPGRAAAP